jgi:SAM-dependent methyltransferase
MNPPTATHTGRLRKHPPGGGAAKEANPGASNDLDADFTALLEHPLIRRTGMEHHLRAYRPRYTHLHTAVRTYLADPQGPLADIGCGYGVALWLLRNLGFSELIGVDLYTTKDESLLDDLDGSRWIRANLEAEDALAAIPGGTCACVLSSQVFEHLFNYPYRHLEECYRSLRPGGLFLLDIPSPCTLANAWRMVRGQYSTWGDAEFATVRKILKGGEPATTWSIHYREYPPQVLEQLVSLLPNSRIVKNGFVGTAAAPSDSVTKRFAKRALRLCGLANHRLFANVQWLAITKDRPPSPGPVSP